MSVLVPFRDRLWGDIVRRDSPDAIKFIAFSDSFQIIRVVDSDDWEIFQNSECRVSEAKKTMGEFSRCGVVFVYDWSPKVTN